MKILGAEYRQWGEKFNQRHTVEELRSLPINQIIKTIPGGWWKFVFLLLKAKWYLGRHQEEIKIYAGVIYTLRTLVARGFRLIIVTSNSKRNVFQLLDRYNMSELFLAVYPTKGLFRKAQTLKRVLRKYQLKPTDTYYIGDEIRDIQACKKIGLPIISVSYGYNSYRGLQKFAPDYLVKKPVQLLQILMKK
jgi:phosphoglycolate phosphatase-like HAD superfamily hydrolase